MCVGLGHPYRNGFSGVEAVFGRGGPKAECQQSLICQNLIGKKKVECHQRSELQVSVVARDNPKSEAKIEIVMDGEVEISDAAERRPY